MRDLQSSKEYAQKLGRQLKENNLLSTNTTYSWYRNREDEFLPFYHTENGITFCPNASNLLRKLEYNEHDSNWYLFMDSSTQSFKAILINKIDLKVVPLVYAKETKETYSLIQSALKKIKYNDHLWDVCGDFKIISFLMGMQQGYMQYGCFLCNWRSREKDQYCKNDWMLRDEHCPGQKNVIAEKLVPSEKILLPPLHVRLGLFKNFIKSLKPDSLPMERLHQLFPKLSDAKIKAGVFTGPDIKKLSIDAEFQSLLSPDEYVAWESLLSVSKNFLGKF